MKVTDLILKKCNGSTTELARRLTVESPTGQYYTTNQVAHWIRVERIPPEHMSAVAAAFGLPVEKVCPELFPHTKTIKRFTR